MSQKDQVAEAGDQEKLALALDTMAEILVGGKLEAVRKSLAELRSELSDRVDAIKREATEAVERARTDLASRVSELRQRFVEMEARQKTALAELQDKVRRQGEETERKVKEAQSSAASRIQKTEVELKETLARKEAQLKKELGGLAGGLSAIQLELQQQMESSDRMATLLNNVGNLFAGGQGPHQGPSARATRGAPRPDIAADAGSEELLESALDEMFDADRPAASSSPSRADDGRGAGKKSKDPAPVAAVAETTKK